MQANFTVQNPFFATPKFASSRERHQPPSLCTTRPLPKVALAHCVNTYIHIYHVHKLIALLPSYLNNAALLHVRC